MQNATVHNRKRRLTIVSITRLLVALALVALVAGCAGIGFISVDPFDGRPSGPLFFTNRDYWELKYPPKPDKGLVEKFSAMPATKMIDHLIALEGSTGRQNRIKRLSAFEALATEANRERLRPQLQQIMLDTTQDHRVRYRAFSFYYPPQGNMSDYANFLDLALDIPHLRREAFHRMMWPHYGFGSLSYFVRDKHWIGDVGERARKDLLLKHLSNTNECIRAIAAVFLTPTTSVYGRDVFPLAERRDALLQLSNDPSPRVQAEARRVLALFPNRD